MVSPNVSSPATGRLTPDEVAHYRREGYLIHNKPVLAQDRFDALKAYFEKILADLPASERPESMDVPHFMHPKLLEWAFDPAILSLVEPILGPDIALFSTHFICKPKGNGKRVPWHEDSAYWKGQIEPMEVCTVWLAIDPSTRVNGCMMVIPRTHQEGRAGFSDYEEVDTQTSVFGTEILKEQRNDAKKVHIELQPNQCSLHDARIQHGSEPNTSTIRRCGWTMRFCSTRVKFATERFAGAHHVYLAKGLDHGGNVYADPKRAYPEVLAKRGESTRYKNSH
ncbi:phytanoyl-CoA dioxygenase family protein [Nibricoccus sp. IMCC34717]|uniref:phytanoyl-CoA dioxygenase family protein n=1 Tax=Nibricoccus sp. IMCC34717 TaxID=3034021 RepID=UPI00384F0948